MKEAERAHNKKQHYQRDLKESKKKLRNLTETSNQPKEVYKKNMQENTSSNTIKETRRQVRRNLGI